MKNAGCDHMFCTDCKTTFSWRTMEIQPQGNSNPLYWQWVHASRPQVTGPGRAPPPPELCRTTGRFMTEMNSQLNEIPRLVGLGHALIDLDLYKRREFIRESEVDTFTPLRIKYLLKDITEDEWRVAIQRADKKKRKFKFMADILDLFCNGTMDIVGFLQNRTYDAETTSTQVHQLRELCNRELLKMHSIFGSTVYHVTTEFLFRAL